MNIRLNENQKVMKINAPVFVHELIRSILMRESKIRRIQEHFWVIGLNSANKIQFVELVGLGADNKVTVSPREVFRISIQKLAQSIIIVHNHPSGIREPSNSDNNLTDYFVRLGSFLNLPVLDHIIITETNGYYSYAESVNITIFKSIETLKQYDFDKKHEKLIYNQIKEKIVLEIKTKIAKEFIKTTPPLNS